MPQEHPMTTADILAAIGRAKNRNEAARAYRAGLLDPDAIDWSAVNAKILERWTMSGLEQIRCWAWKMERGE